MNNLSANIKLSEIHLSRIVQSGRVLSRLFGVLLKTGLSLMTNVPKPLAKSLLITLGLTPVASAANAGIHKISLGIRESNINNFKWINGWYDENS